MGRIMGLACLFILATTAVAAEKIEILYIANGMNRSGKGGAITAFRINRNNGSLTPVLGSPFDAAVIPYSLTTDNGTHLYLANPALDDDNLRVYPIRPDTGRLEFEHVSTFEGSNYEGETNCCPGPILADVSGHFAYVGNTANKTISTFEIFPGSLALTRSSTAYTRPGHFPVDLVWGPQQSTIFALTDPGLAISLVHVYWREPSKGDLKEAADSPWRIANLMQATSIAQHKLFIALTRTPTSSELKLFSIGEEGKLTAVSGSPFRLESAGRAITLTAHPTGDWIAVILASNDGTPSVFIYKLSSDPRISTVTSLPLPCPKDCQITSATFDASGNFLYLADASQNRLIGLSFDPANNALQPIPGSPWNAGDQPHSLLVVEPR
jgi:6-phosphogluconolactonase (cycloisomerase 2 family)